MFTIWTLEYNYNTSNWSFANAMRWHSWKMQTQQKYKVT